MIPELKQAFDAASDLPEDRQKELAETLVQMVARPFADYTPTQRAGVDQGVADVMAGRFVSDDELERTLASFGAK